MWKELKERFKQGFAQYTAPFRVISNKEKFTKYKNDLSIFTPKEKFKKILRDFLPIVNMSSFVLCLSAMGLSFVAPPVGLALATISIVLGSTSIISMFVDIFKWKKEHKEIEKLKTELESKSPNLNEKLIKIIDKQLSKYIENVRDEFKNQLSLSEQPNEKLYDICKILNEKSISAFLTKPINAPIMSQPNLPSTVKPKFEFTFQMPTQPMPANKQFVPSEDKVPSLLDKQ